MQDLKKIRLGDVCKINVDSYSTKEKWDFVNYLDTGNITNNTINSIQFIDLKNNKLPNRAKRKVKTDSIIYSTVRPNQRHFGIIKSQPENFLVSTGFAVIEADAWCT
ncbi:restriction endonuclease subunit S [Enterococcus cecorum]